MAAITGATYTWTKSNNITLTGSGSSVLARAVSGVMGAGWIECAVNSPCGGIRSTRINVQVGPYSTSQIIVSGQVAVCSGNQYVYSASPSGSAYNWTWPSGWTKIGQAGNQITLSVPSSSPSGGTVRVSITNGCGASGYSGITVFPINCGSFATTDVFTVYPNPVNQSLTVEQSFEENSTFADTSVEVDVEGPDDEPFNVVLFNGTQERVAGAVSDEGRAVIDASRLPAGMYILQIVHRHKTTTKHILIEQSQLYCDLRTPGSRAGCFRPKVVRFTYILRHLRLFQMIKTADAGLFCAMPQRFMTKSALTPQRSMRFGPRYICGQATNSITYYNNLTRQRKYNS